MDIVGFVSELVAEFGVSQGLVHGTRQRPEVGLWKAPCSGWCKANFDGAWFRELQCLGIGVIVRDDCGKVIAACSKQVPSWADTDVAEAYAALSAVQFVRELGLSAIHLEGDSSLIIKEIQLGVASLSPFGHLISAIINELSSFSQYKISHVHREGNSAAYCLARMAVHSAAARIWMEASPPAISLIVAQEASCPP
ncbi:hypothetical protein CsSME_00012936 [Camellia sinensis var. sinensis]